MGGRGKAAERKRDKLATIRLELDARIQVIDKSLKEHWQLHVYRDVLKDEIFTWKVVEGSDDDMRLVVGRRALVHASAARLRELGRRRKTTEHQVDDRKPESHLSHLPSATSPLPVPIQLEGATRRPLHVDGHSKTSTPIFTTDCATSTPALRSRRSSMMTREDEEDMLTPPLYTYALRPYGAHPQHLWLRHASVWPRDAGGHYRWIFGHGEVVLPNQVSDHELAHSVDKLSTLPVYIFEDATYIAAGCLGPHSALYAPAYSNSSSILSIQSRPRKAFISRFAVHRSPSAIYTHMLSWDDGRIPPYCLFKPPLSTHLRRRQGPQADSFPRTTTSTEIEFKLGALGSGSNHICILQFGFRVTVAAASLT
ncbi:hypothetical protein C8F01DRAFT_1234438 [Mycena amicta]|nr:hypothetical protein C8F01DRAFT_1234438 [Mycena amicta]